MIRGKDMGAGQMQVHQNSGDDDEGVERSEREWESF